MLWAVHHKWTIGARLAFNFYRHWSTLVIRAGDRMIHFLQSKDGLTKRIPCP